MEGTLAADAASLRETLRWAGRQTLPGGGFGRFALKAQANVVGSTLGLSGVNIELDGNAGEGVLTLANGGRQTLQGTLAADTLDLTPYVSTVRLLTTGQRDWDRQPITLDGLKGIDVDLRLSAARVNIAHVRLGRTAVNDGGAAATQRGDRRGAGFRRRAQRLVRDRACAGRGRLQGAAAIRRRRPRALSRRADRPRRLEGKSIAFALDSSGGNVLVTKALNGTANLTGRKGALSGFNIEQLLRRFERRPLSGGGEVRGGKTPYETLTVNVKISQGMAVEEVRMEGPSVRIALGGAASIPSRQLDLKGTASLLSSTAGGATAAAPHSSCRSSWKDLGRAADVVGRPEPHPALGAGAVGARCHAQPSRWRPDPLGDRAAHRPGGAGSGSLPPPTQASAPRRRWRAHVGSDGERAGDLRAGRGRSADLPITDDVEPRGAIPRGAFRPPSAAGSAAQRRRRRPCRISRPGGRAPP